jgi:hypothetical protein
MIRGAMSVNPPSGADARRLQDPLRTPTGPESRDLSGTRHFDRNVLMVERWAIAVRRLDVGLVDELERSKLEQRPDIVRAVRAVPVRAPSAWVQWLQRFAERIRQGRGDRQGGGDNPPRLQPR